jgi:hypothetical protein
VDCDALITWIVHLKLDPTWILAIANIALVVFSRLDSRAQRRAMERATEERVGVVRSETKLRTLLRYEDKWDALAAERAQLAVALLTKDSIPKAVPKFFESLAVMLDSGDVDPEKVWSFFERDVRFYWHALKEHIQKEREQYKDNLIWCDFDKLVAALAQIEVQKTASAPATPTAEQITTFLEGEAGALLQQCQSTNRARSARISLASLLL